MVLRCILGCSPPQPLFPIPKDRWLRVRWLQFLHFDEGGITENTRVCVRHFTQESFKNFTRYEMGLVKILHLTNTAVPSIYTVGASPDDKPLTRDVGCQCSPRSSRSAAAQASFSAPRPKRRSKAVQVKSLSLSDGASSSSALLHPALIPSTAGKRRRVEECEADESWSSSSEESTAYDTEDSKESLFAELQYGGNTGCEYGS